MADAASHNQRRINDLRVDFAHKCVHYKGQIIYLSPRLLKTVDCIYAAAPYCADREMILKAVWGHKWDNANDSNVDKAIGVLNKKLIPYGLEIENVPRTGYRLRSIHEEDDTQNALGRREGVSNIPLLDHLDVRECLIRLGCSKKLLSSEEPLVRTWLGKRVDEPLWRSEGPQLHDSLREQGESDKVCSAVDTFVQHLVYCCAPRHGGVTSLYLSARKISEAFQKLQVEMKEGTLPNLSSERQIVSVHDYLLRTNRLVFLPARLLLGGALPTREDEFFYFAGLFTFASDDRELAKVPGVLDALSNNPTDLAVTSFFANPDPFVCPFLKFSGDLHHLPVTMNISRKYLKFSSATAAILPSILSKRRLNLRGIGTMKHHDEQYEVQPLACGF